MPVGRYSPPPELDRAFHVLSSGHVFSSRQAILTTGAFKAETGVSPRRYRDALLPWLADGRA